MITFKYGQWTFSFITMKLLLFLGAGASYELGFMTTPQMKKHLEELVKGYDAGSILKILMNTPFNDVEELFYALISLEKHLSDNLNSKLLQNLITRSTIFIQQDSAPLNLSSFKEKVNQALNLLEEEIYKKYRWNNSLKDRVTDLYHPLIKTIKKNNRLTICTTNYDKSIENYCKITDTRYYDGFVPDNYGSYIFKGFKNSPQDSILFLKIHGSLDWKKNGDEIVKTLEESKSADSNFSENLWIVPTLGGKSLDDPPFKEIFEKFKEELQGCDICFCIGYSFRDTLINDEFKKFIKQKGKLVILNPYPKEIPPRLEIANELVDKDLQNPEVLNNMFKIPDTSVTIFPNSFRKENIKEISEIIILDLKL
ncbi:hypothetical protein BH23THE1_BH23THE1_12280 [soil metagenome]